MAGLAFSLTIRLVRISILAGLLLSSVRGLHRKENLRVSKTAINMEYGHWAGHDSEIVFLLLVLAVAFVWNGSSPEPSSHCVLGYSSLGAGFLFEVPEDTCHQVGLH